MITSVIIISAFLFNLVVPGFSFASGDTYSSQLRPLSLSEKSSDQTAPSPNWYDSYLRAGDQDNSFAGAHRRLDLPISGEAGLLRLLSLSRQAISEARLAPGVLASISERHQTLLRIISAYMDDDPSILRDPGPLAAPQEKRIIRRLEGAAGGALYNFDFSRCGELIAKAVLGMVGDPLDVAGYELLYKNIIAFLSFFREHGADINAELEHVIVSARTMKMEEIVRRGQADATAEIRRDIERALAIMRDEFDSSKMGSDALRRVEGRAQRLIHEVEAKIALVEAAHAGFGQSAESLMALLGEARAELRKCDFAIRQVLEREGMAELHRLVANFGVPARMGRARMEGI